MNILLDTHVLIWALENNPTLSDNAKSIIIHGGNMVFVSSVSILEIGIKRQLGKFEAPDNLQEEIKLHRFTPLYINHDHAELAAKLPNIHKACLSGYFRYEEFDLSNFNMFYNRLSFPA